MIGRATYGRPWIFKEIKHYLSTGEHMPELTTEYGYFVVLGVMFALSIGLYIRFKRAGWL